MPEHIQRVAERKAIVATPVIKPMEKKRSDAAIVEEYKARTQSGKKPNKIPLGAFKKLGLDVAQWHKDNGFPYSEELKPKSEPVVACSLRNFIHGGFDEKNPRVGMIYISRKAPSAQVVKKRKAAAAQRKRVIDKKRGLSKTNAEEQEAVAELLEEQHQRATSSTVMRKRMKKDEEKENEGGMN